MSLLALTAAVANQLEQQLIPQLPELQVTSQLNDNPTPPAIDLYPAEPFQDQTDYGPLIRAALWIVRVRVTKADQDSGQTLLLQMMDPTAAVSVTSALTSNPGFGGACQDSTVEGPLNWGTYADPGGQGNELMGCQWRLRTIL
jgi:hypothetical protein